MIKELVGFGNAGHMKAGTFTCKNKKLDFDLEKVFLIFFVTLKRCF